MAYGCATAGSQTTAERRRPRVGQVGSSETCCVMEVPGAALDVNEIDKGLALSFTTIDRDSVATMRAAVERLAHSFRNGENDHLHDRHGEARPRRVHWHYTGFPTARVEVVQLANGARIELRAAGDTTVDALRREAWAEAEMMRRGACPLLPTELAAQPPGNL